ncbi:MAG: hypothetical protein KJ737_26320 [Proteobacteria bacterium]|nr:hypothetical protein [Pseudomonadota bacterium]
MKKLLVILFVFAFSVSSTFAGAYVFKQEDASDLKKFTKKTLDLNLKKLKKLGIKKLVIMECYGEYVTSKEVTSSANSQRYTGRITTNTNTLNLGKDFYTDTSNLVYQAVKEAFEKNGIEVVSREDLLANEKYANFNLEEEKEGRGASAGLYKPTVVEKTQSVSASNLGIFPSNPLKMIKLLINICEITHSVGAEAVVQVKFKVDKDKNFKPILKQFDVIMSAEIKPQEVGFKGNKKMRYDFLTQNEPLVKMKTELITADEVTDGKKGPFNVEKYDKALMGILYTVTDSLSFGIKEILSK